MNLDKVQAAVADMFKPKFFNNSVKKGETFELRAELNADTKDKRKEAVKKTIANMTVGKDVSMLFADVVKNMQTDDLEMKKLVYLYLMNYAKSQPELVILAVNTFVKDCDDPNPLIRALAIRTMGCLRVQKILDYISEPLRKGLKDDHPYVRKTAAICVAKLFDLSPQLCVDNGFITILQEMLSDINPMVVANAVAALVEIKEAAPRREIFTVNPTTLNKLLTALNECTEWGQISILEALAAYQPVDVKEAEQITERVLPRLQHINSSVVITAVKLLVIYLEHVAKNDELFKTLVKKLTPPLVTLLAADPEIQYVALRNINLILQRRPDILNTEMRVFFCQYNDPPFVKLEKLEVMIKLASEKNVEQVVSELKEYANEVDVDFVRKAVQAIGRCAVKIDHASERCVGALLDLIKNKVNYVVQEAIIVIKDIFRKYPNRYEAIIPTLCENLESLDEPDAKASMIWIVGEYAQKIDNANELIEYFMETFKVERPQVQLQLLTATVKLFLKKPSHAQDLVQKMLQMATTTGESADLRDKAYIYWRLLSTDPQAAKAVVLAEKPPIAVDAPQLSSSVLTELIRYLSTIAAVYHKPPSAFLNTSASAAVIKGHESDEEEGGEEVGTAAGGAVGDLLDLDFGSDGGAMMPAMNATSVPSPANQGALFDLLGDTLTSPSVTAPAFSPQAIGPSLGGGLEALVQPSSDTPAKILLAATQGKGLEVKGQFSRKSRQTVLHLTFSNKAMTPMTDFAIQFNKNRQVSL